MPSFRKTFATNVVLNITLRLALLRTVNVLTAFLLIEELVSKAYDNDIKTLIVIVVIFAHHLLR
jgi:hypothetical protein